ncbi:TPM domain-containing protein, partial [Synechococcus sp. H55.9]
SASGNWLVLVLPFLAVVTTDGILGSKRGIPFQPVVCQSCGRPMRPIQPQILDGQLPPAHRLAKSRRRARYYGWFCPACQGMAVVVRENKSYRHLYCPQCQALTLDLQTEIIRRNIYPYTFRRETLTCPLCQYRTEREVEVQEPDDSDYDTRDRDRNFGGGSSHGDGAGGSW